MVNTISFTLNTLIIIRYVYTLTKLQKFNDSYSIILSNDDKILMTTFGRGVIDFMSIMNLSMNSKTLFNEFGYLIFSV